MLSELSNTLRPLFITHLPLGLSPFTVQGHLVHLRRLHSIYALVFLVAISSLYTFVFFTEPVSDTYEEEEEGQTREFVQEAADTLESYCSAIASSVCVLYNFIHRRKVATIINNLQWFDKSLQRQNNRYYQVQNITKPKRNRMKTLENAARILFIFLTSWYWMIASGVLEMTIYPEETIPQWLMYVVPIGITTQLTFQFAVVTNAVRWRFRALNRFVAHNGRPAMEYTMSAHAYLSTIVAVLKEAYSNQILAVVAQSSVTIVASAFFLAYAVMHSEDDNTIWLYAYTLVMWTYCILQMASVAWASVSLASEVRKTVRISFGEILDYSCDNTSRMLFAFQAMHDDAEFELCRGFPVDGSLLSNLAGTVTTYLLIVIQFEMNMMG